MLVVLCLADDMTAFPGENGPKVELFRFYVVLIRFSGEKQCIDMCPGMTDRIRSIVSAEGNPVMT
jgi:hypothetical protein